MGYSMRSYAPVHESEIDRTEIARGFIQGYAAPKRGPKWCRLELVSGGKLVAVADACGYSEIARANGVRFGWCRFDMGGLAVAGALAELVQIRCAISGALVAEFEAEALVGAVPKRQPLTLSALCAFISELRGCSSLEQISPFAERYREIHAEKAFVEALYVYLLKRRPSAREVDDFLRDLPEGWNVGDCWKKMTSSPEFARRPSKILPGGFDPGFSFGLELLQ
jgi:hypothetical protein